MSEKHQRKRVIQWLKPLNAIPVENPAQPGTPDVNYVEGWIELKKLNKWPSKPDLIVRVEHFTPQQRNWHILRHRRNGVSWVLLQVKNDWVLLQGMDAAEILGRVNKADLLQRATMVWSEAPGAGLREALRAHVNCQTQ